MKPRTSEELYRWQREFGPDDMEQERRRELAQEVEQAQRDNKCSREDYEHDETDDE